MELAQKLGVYAVYNIRPPYSSSRSPQVDDFGTNRKRICDVLLVINSNFGPILHRF